MQIKTTVQHLRLYYWSKLHILKSRDCIQHCQKGTWAIQQMRLRSLSMEECQDSDVWNTIHRTLSDAPAHSANQSTWDYFTLVQIIPNARVLGFCPEVIDINYGERRMHLSKLCCGLFTICKTRNRERISDLNLQASSSPFNSGTATFSLILAWWYWNKLKAPHETVKCQTFIRAAIFGSLITQSNASIGSMHF